MDPKPEMIGSKTQLLNPILFHQQPARHLANVIGSHTGSRVVDDRDLVECLANEIGRLGELGRESFSKAAEAILEEWRANGPKDGRFAAYFLDLLHRVGSESSVFSMRLLLDSRVLCKEVDGYSDLHGRLLEAYFPLQIGEWEDLWRVEREYLHFLPLLFSLIRDHIPSAMAEVIIDVCQFGQLREALHSVALELDGPTRIAALQSLAIVVAEHSQERAENLFVDEFVASLALLGLDRLEEEDLRRVLSDTKEDPAPVVLAIRKELAKSVRSLLTSKGVTVFDASIGDLNRGQVKSNRVYVVEETEGGISPRATIFNVTNSPTPHTRVLHCFHQDYGQRANIIRHPRCRIRILPFGDESEVDRTASIIAGDAMALARFRGRAPRQPEVMAPSVRANERALRALVEFAQISASDSEGLGL